ncbi:MAG TPA: redoxin domain-containing protein [Chloroflexota bacterium]|nr:redoxin domain-containing protein [Chloroflexota bacterium]
MGKWDKGPARGGWAKLVALTAVVVLLGLALFPRSMPSTQGSTLAPDFILPTANGVPGTLALNSLRGHPVLLNFFNSECVPCIQEMPLLRQTALRYKARGLVVLAVATGGDSQAGARSFAQARHLSFPVVVDEHQDVAWLYQVAGWPTSFFLDPRGRIRGQLAGPLDDASLRDGLALAGALPCTACHSLPPPKPAAGAGGLSADTIFSAAPAAQPFALRDQRGQVVSLRSLRGKVVALTFVSAICTAECPLIGRALGQVSHDLGPEAAHLAIVAISVAPEADTGPAIRRFAADAGWRSGQYHYLSGSHGALAAVWAAYGIWVGPYVPGQDPEHTPALYLIDRRGRLRAYYDVPFLAPRVASSVRALLAS